MQNFVINVEAAIHKNGKWLVGIRSKKEAHAGGLLSFVGGVVEHTDPLVSTLESAVIREVKEEIDLEVKVIDFVNDTLFVSQKGNRVINMVFLCEVVSGEAKITHTEEMESLLWLTTEEILNFPHVPKWLCESVKIAGNKIS